MVYSPKTRKAYLLHAECGRRLLVLAGCNVRLRNLRNLSSVEVPSVKRQAAASNGMPFLVWFELHAATGSIPARDAWCQ